MRIVVALVFLSLVSGRESAAQSGTDLSGLWEATLRLGPDVVGPILVYETPGGLAAEVGGFRVPATRSGEFFSFQLSDGKGELRDGFWISDLSFATPARFRQLSTGLWRADITPVQERYTMFLPIRARPDGMFSTYLRNPERNFGVFIRATHIALAGDTVRLIGARRRSEPDTAVLAQGHFGGGTFSLPFVGATFDFARVADTSSSSFFPRGHPGARYHYVPPIHMDDGWEVGSLEDNGISRDSIERIVQSLIDMPMDSLATMQLHSLLIARHGRLVLEEYFHGHDRFTPHDTRSASKSWMAVLIGAAMQAGVPLRLDAPVYRTMLGTVPPDLEPRKRAMTLEHLLTMTAGFNCDPNDSTSADEDVMNERGVRNWHDYTLNVPLITAPGDSIFYCSTSPHLAGGMLAKVAGEPLIVLFDRLLALPLRLENYHLGLRDGDLYGGGGSRFTSRDFAKLGQLTLNGGRWGNRQIISEAWVRQSGAPLRQLGTQQYGFLWNSIEYPFKGRTVRAIFAAGNGGQISMAIPELDLVIAVTAGNYNARTFDASVLLPAIE
jgi:CubicO group peptidase (beta-lactamase class C family)